MAQEIKRNDPGKLSPARHVDPFQAMRAEMDRVFDSFLGGGLPAAFLGGPAARANAGMHVPSVDIRETDGEILIEAELPGIEEKDVDVTVRDGVLTLKGEKRAEREEKQDDYHVSERSYGSFQRSFRLPETVDVEKVSASFEKGVLKVTLPKLPAAAKAERRIEIGKG